MTPFSIRAIFCDKHFLAAILAAIVFWLALFLWRQPSPVMLWWPLVEWEIALQVVLLYPILEELLFRGYLQGYLLGKSWARSRLVGISSANLVTSLIFTAAHFLYHPPLAAATVLIPSLIFGYFRDRHGRLLSPILLHAYYNLGYFWLFSV
jgi:membrane protease YdiL (CAAX protease family)